MVVGCVVLSLVAVWGTSQDPTKQKGKGGKIRDIDRPGNKVNLDFVPIPVKTGFYMDLDQSERERLVQKLALIGPNPQKFWNETDKYGKYVNTE
jgi:hypothetical protein